MRLPTTIRIRPSWAVVLIDNVMNCDDAENDAERTVDELLAELDENNGFITRSVLESALYCCNMQDEKKAFKHPQGLNFQPFVKDILGKNLSFDRYYNRIYRNEDGPKTQET